MTDLLTNPSQAITDYQVEDYRLSASMNALNVAQSLVIFSGLAAGLVVCTKVRGIFPVRPCATLSCCWVFARFGLQI